MKNLYEKNGLVFWSEREIKLRRMFEEYFVSHIGDFLKVQNSAFDVIQVEAPQLTPIGLINPSYTKDDYFPISEELVLRPETTMGSYLYASDLLNPHQERRIKLPLCVWQHGKSFRNEQDKTQSNMRLKEFYQLEFQVIYSPSTANDYYSKLVIFTHELISKMIGESRIELSDRLPDYSEVTTDVVMSGNGMEVCSISKRKDFPNALVTEIAIGTDRCVYNFNL